jgi:hypothetical protein
MLPFLDINAKSFASGLLTALILLSRCSALCQADGGQLRLVERCGNLQISVFTAPNPLRAGPVDISVLVQESRTCQPIDDLAIRVQLKHSGRRGVPIVAAATKAAATNKLFHAAMIDLPAPGKWSAQIACDASGERARIDFELDAANRLPELASAWIWFMWPVGAVLIFGIHRALVARRQKSRTNV